MLSIQEQQQQQQVETDDAVLLESSLVEKQNQHDDDNDDDDNDDDDDDNESQEQQEGEEETTTTRTTNNKSSFYSYYRTETGRMPRLWLRDRCHGQSYYDPEDNDTTTSIISRPPSRLCWPPVPLQWCPDLLEQNCLCETVGKWGCVALQQPESHKIKRRRTRLFQVAFASNVIGLCLLIVTTMAISKEYYNLIWNISFANVRLEIIQGPQDYETAAYYNLGLRAAAIESKLIQKQSQQQEQQGSAAASSDDGENGQVIHTFDEFCNLLVGAQQQQPETTTKTTPTTATAATNLFVTSTYQDERYDCNGCNDISHKIVPSLFLSMLSYIPNFSTDILRMWTTYDVNCQKFMGSVFSWISLATAIYTWVNYRKGCFDTLNTDPFALNQDLEKIEDGSQEEIYMIVAFTWEAGVGQICLAIASLLKILDIFLNCIVPTPTITRDHAEQVEYEWKYGKRRVGDDDDDDNEEDHDDDDDDDEEERAEFSNEDEVERSSSDLPTTTESDVR